MWATGILLFEMLALRVPFEARSLHELTKKIIKSHTPRIPAEYQVSVPEDGAPRDRFWEKAPAKKDAARRNS